jgi:hypothetical protein
MDNFFKAEGTVENILEPSSFELSGKLNISQLFSIKTDNEKEIALTLFNSATDCLISVNKGDKVEVSFEIDSKFSKGRYFNNMKCVFLRKLK